MKTTIRWSSVALLALAPKCVLCLAGYAGLGALLGIRVQEICGAAGAGFPWRPALAGGGLALGIFGLVASFLPRRRKDPAAAGPVLDGRA